jgi:hypothetical protein
MKTEQVTLAVVHDEKDRLGSASGWEWQTMVDATIGQDSESPVEVRVVEQPRGWLTGEEREAVQWAADAAYDKQHPAEDTLRNLLARSLPPEVVLESWREAAGEVVSIDDVRAALAAIGVEVKEVGE